MHHRFTEQMFQKLFFLTALVCVSLIGFTQGVATVKGTVKDTSGRVYDGVFIAVQENAKFNTYSDTKGFFELKVPAGKKITLIFSSLNIETQKGELELSAGESININAIVTEKVNQLKDAVIKGERTQENGASTVDVKVQQQLPSVNEGIEAYLVYQLGVTKSNELSSNYSVRGGNFDENLVYVNDFEVYRPFLIRSGQQEGLSFVNTNLVSNVKFTSGGFQARYGDKMASVLDVTYKKPKKFGGSIYGSLLGFGGHLEGCDKKQRFTFLVGVRQRLSQYILNSLEEKGQYSPNFLDVQGYFTFQATEKLGIDYIVNYARNNYVFKPVNRETSFGLLTDVKKLTVYFDGQEADRYQSLMNGLALTYLPNDNLKIKFLGSHYMNREKEAYDILGEYYLSQVESDLGKSSFGDILYSLGVGGLQDWARNTLNTDVYYAGHRGSWFKKGHNLQWGVDYKREVISDKISEWDRTDSAGYSIPYQYTSNFANYDSAGNLIPFTKLTVDVNRTLKSSFDLKSNRYSAFIQDSWKFGDSSRFNLTYGLRFQFWDVNKEPVITPRVQFTYKPKGKADLVLNLAAGTYYQPPFYREMRDLNGKVNTNLRAQKSFHAVAGVTYAFKAWKRPFSFTTEVYYKYLWDMVPYEFDNVLIRYFGQNQSKGYAAGIDMRLNGELAEGLESWITMSVMSTQEDLIGDKYTAYYDSAGNELTNNSRNASLIVDSSTIYPGYIPRPTDQRVNFSMFFQDYIPKFPFIKVHLSLIFGTGLPFGPPDNNRYKDVLRIPPYRRVDIGFSGQLWNPKWAKKENKFNQGLKSVWASLEVFNIFGITNTVSYLWVSDIYGSRYAVPNYLTARRINAKVVFNF